MKRMIYRYFNAFENLYGIIPMTRAYRIIEKQNPEWNLTKEKFAEIVNGLDISEQHYVIWSESELYDENAEETNLFHKMLIAEYIVIFGNPEDYEELVSEQKDRTFYVPPKDELLKYGDPFYFERTRHTTNIENYLRDDLGLTNYKEIVEEFVGLLRIDGDLDDLVTELRRIAVPRFKDFSDKQQAQKFYNLCINLHNHSRKHTHRGHTPFELDDCYALDSVVENPIVSKRNAPSKNGKCPCGSGKKYKRCCGKEKEKTYKNLLSNEKMPSF